MWSRYGRSSGFKTESQNDSDWKQSAAQKQESESQLEEMTPTENLDTRQGSNSLHSFISFYENKPNCPLFVSRV